jgi:uncharacterized Zn finger protein
MADRIEVSCPDCGERNFHTSDWLQRHSEVNCKNCGTVIDVVANKTWGELKRLYNAQHNDGPVRRRLP